MSSVLKSLVHATGVKPEKGEDRQEYLNRLITAVDELSDVKFDKTDDDSQIWFNAAAKAVKAGDEIDDPDPPKDAKSAKKAAAKPAADEEEADEEEADEEEADEEEADEVEEDEADEEEAGEADEEEADEEEADEVVPVKPAKKAAKKSEPAKKATKKSEPAKKAEPAKKSVNAADDEEKPAKKKASGDSNKFRRAYINCYLKGKTPKPADVIEQTGVNLCVAFARLLAQEARCVIDILREKKLID